MLVVWLLDNRC